MHRYLHLLYSIVFLSSSFVCNAQLTRGSANYAAVAEEVSGINDSIFLFNEDIVEKFILAHSPNGSEANFEWFTYNELTQTFQSVRSETGISSQFNISENLGLRVVITGGGNDSTSQCWALVNNFTVDIYNADIEIEDSKTIKKVPDQQKWCHLIRGIKARVDSSELRYYNWDTGEAFLFPWNFGVARNSWSANPEPEVDDELNVFLKNDQYFLNIDVEYPYWEDTWYILTITDRYGFESSDSVFYESIEPHADFDVEYIKLNNEEHYPDRSERYYEDLYGDQYSYISAPAKYKLNNLSVNADTMIWSFGDMISMTSAEDSVYHMYDLPGTYFPKLVVYNVVDHLYDVCSDTFPTKGEEVVLDGYPIEIEESNFELDKLPNVFSCGEGEYNYFRFIGDVSITDFEIAIYNRFGNRMYHYEGNIRDWEGWDGKKNEGRYVSTGVYFYVVRDIGRLKSFDSDRILKLPGIENASGEQASENNILRGFIHVYNND